MTAPAGWLAFLLIPRPHELPGMTSPADARKICICLLLHEVQLCIFVPPTVMPERRKKTRHSAMLLAVIWAQLRCLNTQPLLTSDMAAQFTGTSEQVPNTPSFRTVWLACSSLLRHCWCNMVLAALTSHTWCAANNCSDLQVMLHASPGPRLHIYAQAKCCAGSALSDTAMPLWVDGTKLR